MGCPFVYDDELDTIELGEEWVKIKKRMSYGDYQKLLSSYTKGGAMNIEEGNIALLLINIKEWSFKDRDGKPAPVSRENILRLVPDIAQKILDEIGRRNPLLGETSTKKSGRS